MELNRDEKINIAIILLAAGNSKRFQGNKLLAVLDNKPIYLHIVDKIIPMNINYKVLVTQYDTIIDTLKNNAQYHSLKIIKNNHSNLGISYSIKLGIESIQDEEPEGYLFAVCDQPWIKRESLEKLVKTFLNTEKGIVCFSVNNQLGNPVIFDKKYKEELLNLEGDIGGKTIIKKYFDDLKIISPSDPEELIDIDTKKDYTIFAKNR